MIYSYKAVSIDFIHYIIRFIKVNYFNPIYTLPVYTTTLLNHIITTLYFCFFFFFAKEIFETNLRHNIQ